MVVEQKTNEVLERSKERIKTLREEKHKTQNQVAKDIDVSATSIKNWELGTKTPNRHSLLLMAEYFGVSYEYISGEEVEECRQKRNANILVETGLSEKSIEMLRLLVSESKSEYDKERAQNCLNGLNYLLEELYKEYEINDSDNLLSALYKCTHFLEYAQKEKAIWCDIPKPFPDVQEVWFSVNKDIVDKFLLSRWIKHDKETVKKAMGTIAVNP